MEFKQHISTSVYKGFFSIIPNLILFASPKLILIAKSLLMMKRWKYLDTVLSEKITHVTVNLVESVLTIKARSHSIICLSETYFDYEIPPDDENLEIPG